MTVVDSRGRRAPAGTSGRSFSGPPPGLARARSGARVSGHPTGSTTEFRAPSRRPGSLTLWLVALVGCGIGVIVGAAGHETSYHSPGIAYVVCAPLAVGLVKRGRDLTTLVVCLPLASAVSLAAAAAVVLEQDSYPVTTKAVLQELGQHLILHPAALWGGTVLAVVIGMRRGLGRRR